MEKTMAVMGELLDGTIAGNKLLANMFMTKTVKRGFKERFFSRPWKPLQKFKSIPDSSILMHKEYNTIIGHPETLKDLKREWDKTHA